ncbi:hypothetical protein [Streptomyces sp. NPDC002671]
MVTASHEVMHQIFQDHPTLFSSVSEVLGIRLPPSVSVKPGPTDVTETKPVERRIDTLLRIETEDDKPFLLAIEAQKRKDPEKAASWAYYLAYLRCKYRLPTLLFVVCQDRATAKWAARPDPIGYGSWPALTVRPIVVGPDSIPVITDPAKVLEDRPLAILSTIVHGKSPDIEGILKTMAAALQDVSEADKINSVNLIFEGLDTLPAAEIWRELVVSDLKIKETPVYQEGRAEGRAQGKAEDVLRILDTNGVEVPDETRERVMTCRDLDLLGVWFDRAIKATSASEVFAETE